MRKHWYDELWKHLETAAEERDGEAIDNLLYLRGRVAKAETREEMNRVESMFRQWEVEKWD